MGESTGRRRGTTRRGIPPRTDRSPEESRTTRVPLGLKIAGFTAGLLVVITLTVGQVISHVAVDSLDNRINTEGKHIVSTLARTIDRVFWVRPHAPGLTTDEHWEMEKSEARELWNQGLQKLVESSETIRRIIIVDDLNAEEQLQIVSSGPEPIQMYGNRNLYSDKDFRITEGMVEREGQRVRIRRFDAPIDLGQTFEKQPGASVFISAQKIDDMKATFRARITWGTLLAALIGVGLSFLIASIITSPLRILMRDVREVAAGNLEHRTQSHSLDEIGSLAETFGAMTVSLKAARDRELEQRVLEHELDIATEIQTGLLPDRLPKIPGYDVFAYYLSAREVGGDYYDFVQIDPDHLGIVVADVSGKGIPGSMVMTMTRSLLRLASLRNPSPSDTLRKVNRALSRDIRRGMFVTAVYMILNPEERTLRVSNAGHNPVLHYDSRMGAVKKINPRGIALGFDRGRLFDSNLEEITVTLSPSDRILAYTDGVVEALDAEGGEFGEAKLIETLQEGLRDDSKTLVQRILTAVEAHRGETEQSDDITMATFRLEGAS